MFPGQFVGLLPDGSPKNPEGESIAGDDERFIPMVVSEVCVLRSACDFNLLPHLFFFLHN